ncbi:P-loop containing nucleoside triphosphate hydrolase protein [Xylaria nigripes]|nr:P-loop containing nucleoside triphosphate hydrolase protein [Xylaria nigripes]
MTLLPIIYLTGATSTGKGTLGSKLAAEFGFHHISMGDLRRSYLAKLKATVPDVDEDIRPYIIQEKAIPSSLLARYNPIPALFLYQNHRVSQANSGRRSWSYSLALAMLEEAIAEKQALAKPDCKYRAIIIDGHPLTSGTLSADLVMKYRENYSGLTILIECPREDAKKRYLDRARLLSENADRFESRMALTDATLPAFIRLMADYGEIIRSTNSSSMTIDEAYNALVQKLRESRTFQRLIQS